MRDWETYATNAMAVIWPVLGVVLLVAGADPWLLAFGGLAGIVGILALADKLQARRDQGAG